MSAEDKRLSILLIEDEPNLGETLKDFLKSKKYSVELARTCEAAREIFLRQNPFVAIIDMGLPDGSGLELAHFFRQKRRDLVILFCTALNDPKLRVESFELGAEDYITKPFELKELTLRLERILTTKKIQSSRPDEMHFGDLTFWPKRFEVKDAQGSILNLGQKECAILELLIEKKNQAVSRDEIIENIWGENSFPTNRTVDNYIVKLRKWAESDTRSPLVISSLRGIGYKLEIKGYE